MSKYRCTVCGYVYDPKDGDPAGNVEPGTAFDDLTEEWQCPKCHAPKEMFVKF
ncbi:MAG TPA: rubredoxin [Candidatus Omnitrophota bacterium]|nr:rubredoxin [Candidatus Omnitrophota bacterium]